mmetsp:Transcript_40803/g.64241  ORF Transcript_40803/g.64241 Transcript_40803/m.64241 type:complete len:257 (+) Transcript_40803:56-826(+)
MDDFDFVVGRLLDVFRVENSTEHGARVARLDDGAFVGSSGRHVRELLDAMGERSRRAQGLGKAVTAGWQPLSSNRIYVLYDQRLALGLLKVGPKRLFVSRGEKEGLVEISPLCVLDFYVVEGHQRGGCGRQLFDAMLRQEGVEPRSLGYDRPSPKLIGFLRKHFGLVQYQPQANHFVVFDKYWSSRRPSASVSATVARVQPSPFPCGPMAQGWPGKLPGPVPYRLAEGRRSFQRAGSAIASNSSLSLVAAMAQGRL